MSASNSPPPDTNTVVTGAPQAMPRLATFMQRQLDEERAVVARELHDLLGGLLVAAKMDVSRVLSQLSEADAQIRARLARVLGTLDEAVALERGIVERLRPGLLIHVGLFCALRWYVDDMRSRAAGTVITKFPSHELTLSVPVRIALFRIVQDALERAATSSESAIEVEANVRADILEVQVVHRVRPRAAPLGDDDLRVLIMLQRASDIGGELSMGASEDVRRLVVRLPLNSHAAGSKE